MPVVFCIEVGLMAVPSINDYQLEHLDNLLLVMVLFSLLLIGIMSSIIGLTLYKGLVFYDRIQPTETIRVAYCGLAANALAILIMLFQAIA
jgi:hypothetical protein